MHCLDKFINCGSVASDFVVYKLTNLFPELRHVFFSDGESVYEVSGQASAYSLASSL